MSKYLLILFCLGGLLLLPGCKSKSIPVPVPVEGKLTIKGAKSVSGVVVTFWPQDPDNKNLPTAMCKADGTFRLEAPQGSYKVTLVPPKTVGVGAVPGAGAIGAMTPPGKDEGVTIPKKLQDSGQTSLRAIVPEGGTKELVLEVN
jgi:hypothetical protein